MIESFHFLRPFWLLAFLPLGLLIWWIVRRGRRLGNLAEICDPELLPYLTVSGPAELRRRTWQPLALQLAAGLAIIALAGPVWQKIPLPVFRNDAALVIVLDLSAAMDATDLKPSRLDRARFKITDLLQARRDGQTALVIYAGDAFTVTPLTDDTATIQSQLSALTTALPPVQGRRADLGLDLGSRLIQQTGAHSGSLLLISGEVDTDPALESARRAVNLGYQVSVLGVGTATGGPVRTPQGGLWKDSAGNIQIARLDAEGLRAIAQAGGGIYREISSGPSDIEHLIAAVDRPAAPGSVSAEGPTRLEQWVEMGPWLLFAVIPFAALAFRRGALVALLLVQAPSPADAMEWRDLWTRPDVAGAEAFDAKRFDEAAERFRDDAWRSAALYRAGKFEQAIEALQGLDSVEAWYNRGNALAQLQRYPEAIDAYRRVLEREPGHADARYNKELIEKAMKKKEQKSEKSGEGDGEQKNDDKSGQDASKRPADGKPGEQAGNEQPEQQSTQAPNTAGQDSGQAQDEASGDNSEKSGSPASESSAQGQGAESETEQAADEHDGGASGAASEPDKDPVAGQGDPTAERSEAQQANEQWLRRIPDDPAGLLKRKFAWQYRQRQRTNEEGVP